MKKLYFLFTFLAAVFASKAQTPPAYHSVDALEQPVGGWGAGGTSTDYVSVDSGQWVQTSGIFEGPDFYGSNWGHSFYLRGDSLGIEIYANTAYSAPASDTAGYDFHDGDSLLIVGRLVPFYGQNEINVYLDSAGLPYTPSITKVGTGAVTPPVTVGVPTFLNSATLVEVDNVSMDTPVCNWTAKQTAALIAAKTYFSFSSGGIYFDIEKKMNQLMFANTTWSSGLYDVIGYGTTYEFHDTTTGANTWDFDIMPRSLNDFILVSGIQSVSINDIAATVFPNPSNGSFRIKFSDNTISEAQVNMYDLAGRMVYSANQEVDGNVLKVNSEHLSPGMYLIEVTSGESIFRSKITIQK